MSIVAAYLVVGLVVCIGVAIGTMKAKRKDGLPVSLLFDPVWPLIFLWPLWLAIILIEDSFPVEKPAAREPKDAAPASTEQLGTVVVALRPMGRIRIGDAYFDARSDGRIISAGATVRVVSRSMAEVVVEEV